MKQRAAKKATRQTGLAVETVLVARNARIAAGLTIQAAAKRARITPAYLGGCERKRDFPYILAERLSRIYQCRLDVFLPIFVLSSTTGDRAGNAAKGTGAGERLQSPRGKAVSQ